MQRLVDVMSGIAKATIVERDDSYLHVEIRSRLLWFVDDVKFLIDAKTNTIHVRSASRTGYSDFGVNRKRVEAIRKLFCQQP